MQMQAWRTDLTISTPVSCRNATQTAQSKDTSVVVRLHVEFAMLQLQGEFATRIQCLRTQMRLPPQRHASYVACLMWQIRLYVNPQRPCMTMVFRLTVASDCCACPALTAAAKSVMDTGLS